jgi:hypothetical protein
MSGHDSYVVPPEYETGVLTTERERHFLEVTTMKKKDKLIKH